VIGWAWRASARVDRNLKLRSKFVLAALRHPSLAEQLEHLDPSSPLGSLTCEWPDTVGYMLWPYQCAAWDAPTRFARIEGHLAATAGIPGLSLAPDEKMILADLGTVSPNTSLVVDRAKWLSREGHLTLSLFKGQFRAFTLSFSLFSHARTEIFIGGIQGRQDNGILDLYRELTKDFCGVRPRDFMLEALRLFASNIGAQHIYAVTDAQKISRHPYFGRKGAPGLFYDEIWEERGGVRASDSHFELPLGGNRRDLDDVAPKKRSMYRRRYQLLDDIAAMLPRDLGQAERRHFEAS
jgi:uncharacterized protein